MQANEHTTISTALHHTIVWERFTDDVYSIVRRTHIENFFHHINNLELVFDLDTLLKRNYGKISVLIFRKPTHTYCKESDISSLLTRAYFIIINKNDFTKKTPESSKC